MLHCLTSMICANTMKSIVKLGFNNATKDIDAREERDKEDESIC